jgi:hypothetical protein
MKTSKRFRLKDRKRLWASYSEGGCNKKNMSFEWYLENCVYGYIPNDRIKDLLKAIQKL